MDRYCEGCENRCPMDAPQCEHGERLAGGGMRQRDRHGFSEDFDRHGFGPGEGPRGHHGGRRPERGHGRPPFDDHPPRDGFGGQGFRDHPPRDDFGGRDFRGRPPRPMDADALRQRIEEAGLEELILLCGRMLPRNQGGPGHGQALVLSILAGRESMSQRALQQMLGVQPGSLSELVSKLERKGCLTRERGEDRRGNLLRITEAGRQAIPDDPATTDDPFSALNDEQRTQLADLLKLLLNHWIDRMD